MAKTGYKSEALAAIHEMMDGMHQSGLIDKQTMRRFDAACLSDVDVITAGRIREIRLRENVSQPVFAAYLNVSRNLISDWERGAKKPGGAALRLLSVIDQRGLEVLQPAG